MRIEVIEYLQKHYGITKEKAEALVNSDIAKNHIESAQRWKSKPYYPAGQIASQANLVHPENCKQCDLDDKELEERKDRELSEG